MVSRKGAKGAKRYVLLFLCQKYCTQITQNHADALRPFAPLREEFHTESTEYTEKSPRIFKYLRVCFLATNGH